MTRKKGKKFCIPESDLFYNHNLHLDEVEIDMNSIVLQITPTTWKDCAKRLLKITGLVQLVTRKREQKVHKEGRKAKIEKHYFISTLRNQSSVSYSIPTTPKSSANTAFDSSILFKVTLQEITLLVG